MGHLSMDPVQLDGAAQFASSHSKSSPTVVHVATGRRSFDSWSATASGRLQCITNSPVWSEYMFRVFRPTRFHNTLSL